MAHDAHANDHRHPHPPLGHNSHGPARQWQTPHLPDEPDRAAGQDQREPDLDLVEIAFLDAFPRAPDPTSFLRLAGIPFTGRTAEGKTLRLLRVESSHTTHIGALTPHLGGGGHGYDPLPASLASRQNTVSFAYYDGASVVRLSLAEARDLVAVHGDR